MTLLKLPNNEEHQVWYSGVGPIYRIVARMTAVTHCGILNEIMLPYVDDYMPVRWVLQQDNDPKYSSKQNTNFLKNFFQIFLINTLNSLIFRSCPYFFFHSII